MEEPLQKKKIVREQERLSTSIWLQWLSGRILPVDCTVLSEYLYDLVKTLADMEAIMLNSSEGRFEVSFGNVYTVNVFQW